MLLTGKALSMPTMIGLIMLMGIVTKNSILLVDYAILARRAGMDRFEALVDACHKRSRPIVMTTIAMGAGMMPLALGWGADPSFRSPMAVAVIGGLVTSTLLSLLVVPAVFTYIDDAVNAVARLVQSPLAPSLPEVLNIGLSQPVSVLDFVRVLESEVGRQAQLEMLPLPPDDVGYTCADDRLLSRVIGPMNRTPLQEGLHALVRWLQAYDPVDACQPASTC
jgi:predicted RND superfamily exporter protein